MNTETGATVSVFPRLSIMLNALAILILWIRQTIMPNSRNIPQATWAHARECLVFYFSRRHARPDAEDLAQETLLSLWNRDDYTFEKEEGFLKVCYGFARHIAQRGLRDSRQHEGRPLDPGQPAPNHEWGSQRATEARMMLGNQPMLSGSA